MARSMNPNSAGSQFFIAFEDAPHLDRRYAAFGRLQRHGRSRPHRFLRNMMDEANEDQVIKTITISKLTPSYAGIRHFELCYIRFRHFLRV